MLVVNSRAKNTFYNTLEWGSLVCAVFVLIISEDYHPWTNISPVLLLLGWAARRFRTGKLTRSTPVDLPIVLFVVSGLAALWAAPNLSTGLVRFYLIAAAISFFYTIVNANDKSLRLFAFTFIAAIAVLGIFLTSQYDWAQIPGRFGFSREAGQWLNHVVPNFHINLPYWNVTRNILASLYSVSLPIALMSFLSVVRMTGDESNAYSSVNRDRSPIKVWVAGLSFAAIIFGLIITGSRTTWAIFGLGFVVWVWWLLCGIIKIKLRVKQIQIFLIGLGLAALFVSLIFVNQTQYFSLISRIPGPKDFLLRSEFYPQAWRLSQDTPITGGGLAASPALYSTYIRVIPFYAFPTEDNAINAYLNILVEQGWLGLTSYLMIILISLIASVKQPNKEKNRNVHLVTAGLIGLGFILVYGSIHSALAATRAIPTLFIPAGLALSDAEHNTSPHKAGFWTRRLNGNSPSRKGLIIGAVGLIALLGISGLVIPSFRKPILSMLYSNLGAIQMSRIELSGFPTGQWSDGSQVELYSSSEKLFKKALQYDQNNRTAHHRLGLISMLHRDYSTAANLLEKAHQLDPLHRGINKVLGYSYVWSDQPELALPLLVQIPEARKEMEVYGGWWKTQGRTDLANKAEQMVIELQSGDEP